MTAITVSIVSHGHADMVENLLRDLGGCAEIERIILTHNLPEREIAVPSGLEEKILHLHNPSPRGFAENHNTAFRHCESQYYCVLNPDVRLLDNPFPPLCSQLDRPDVAMVAPMAVDEQMSKQDTARSFPTPFNIALRILGRRRNDYEFEYGSPPLEPEWIHGMFFVFRSAAYANVGGFDESYYLYCEDADICARLWQRGGRVVLDPGVRVIHDAQRSSHRNPRFLYWHVSSLLRFFVRHALGRFRQARS